MSDLFVTALRDYVKEYIAPAVAVLSVLVTSLVIWWRSRKKEPR